MGHIPPVNGDTGNVHVGGANAGNVNTGTQIAGDYIAGDKVGHDKIEKQINVSVNQPLSREEQQNRKNLSVMRQAVRKFWIEGVLDKSLYNEALIRLNMAERAGAVDNRPWNLVVQQPGEASHMLPPDTRILDVFDEMQQRLLILGAPGSG